ncbi:MAG: hypothetical protein JNM91_14345, partial [Flavobacteriales bacterium]|nr:hypothetical protein [Flavobacteriales bacterium]
MKRSGSAAFAHCAAAKSSARCTMRRYLLLLLLTFSAAAVRAQELLVKHFDVEQGLPSSTVYRMQVDSHGFLWLATATGVHRYDGSRFEHIGKGSDLDHLVVHHMFVTGVDTLWFAATNGRLFRWDGHRLEEAEALRTRALGTRMDTRIVSLVSDGNGGVRFGYPAMMGAGRLDAHLQVRWDTNGTPGMHVERTATGPLLSHYSTDQSALPNAYPLHYTGPDTAYTLPVGSPNAGNAGPRNFTLQRADGLILVGSGEQLLAFDHSGCRVFHSSDRTLLRAHFTPDAHCVVVYEDGTAAVLDTEGRALPLSLQALHRWRISDVANDRQGGLWISTLGGGLFYAPSLDCTRPIALNEPGIGVITAMQVHPDGTTWLGTNQGTCVVLDAQDRELHRWTLPPTGWLREIR